MLNCSASLSMSTSVLKALPGKLDIKKNTHLVFSIYIGNKRRIHVRSSIFQILGMIFSMILCCALNDAQVSFLELILVVSNKYTRVFSLNGIFIKAISMLSRFHYHEI